MKAISFMFIVQLLFWSVDPPVHCASLDRCQWSDCTFLDSSIYIILAGVMKVIRSMFIV